MARLALTVTVLSATAHQEGEISSLGIVARSEPPPCSRWGKRRIETRENSGSSSYALALALALALAGPLGLAVLVQPL
jgi:type IV pilus biogenesis protein CpaD/CtpE